MLRVRLFSSTIILHDPLQWCADSKWGWRTVKGEISVDRSSRRKQNSCSVNIN